MEIDRKQKKSIIEEIEGHLLEKIEQAQGSDGNELSSSEIKKMLKEFGEPEEIAALVAFIVSPEATFNTGFTFDATGGRATY